MRLQLDPEAGNHPVHRRRACERFGNGWLYTPRPVTGTVLSKDDMQTIRIHRRPRRRIVLTDVASMLGCWLVACFVVSASRYDAFAASFCVAIAIACSVLYAWRIFAICRNTTDFELVLTTTKIFCHSPDQQLCPDFDVELKNIDKVTTDSDGWANLVTSTGAEIKLSRARSFGAPVKRFAQDIASQSPHVSLE
jgi:hypothetical protein